MGRTSLSTNKLKCGDTSLKLSKVKLSDIGTYKCLVPKTGTESVVALTVGSVSSPDMKISKVTNGAVLQCSSEGWYPEPEVLWLDGEGNLLSAGPPETVRGPDDLYTVSSRVTVEKRPSNSFTCRVQQKDTNQTRETTIHLPDDFFMDQSNSAVRITICLAACFMSVMAVFVLWKCGPHQIKNTNGSTERQHLVEEDKTIQLDMKEEKLHEELQKIEGDLKHVQQVIPTLTNQKKDLENQRKKLNSLLDEDNKQIEKNNKKLKEIPKFDTDKKMEKRVKTRKDLDRRKTEHDELLWNTGKLQETAEKMITIMKERKEKLERDKKKINEHLKEMERQREETKLQLEQQEREEEKNNPSSNDDK
ncbi:butyrophilin subfamily 1 member A1-like [Perca fluviatilis]|uniref:butyrophilin subfamily 1 member A1-like n=1 Tax=Perca fluviatilis TaxID=8168 RepID=UPI0019652667|nr:butyrophilin subfamily 1 member A1-like [Perca fluviatilis]